MSALVERMQKQRWSLNPLGKVRSEDSNKFGQKVLEKMGWKHGKESYKDDSKLNDGLNDGDNNIKDETSKPKGKKRKYEESFSPENIPQKTEEEELPKSSKKKKSRKTAESFVSYLNGVGNFDEPLDLEEKEIIDEPNRKKKKKKGKSEESTETDIGDIKAIVVAPSGEEKKKKKSKKQQNEERSEDCATVPSSQEKDKVSGVQSEEVDSTMMPSGEGKKKKKSKKNAEITSSEDSKKESTELQNEKAEENTATTPSSVQKKKKAEFMCSECGKKGSELQSEKAEENIATTPPSAQKKKKSKKLQDEDILEEDAAPSGEENTKSKRSKKISNDLENEDKETKKKVKNLQTHVVVERNSNKKSGQPQKDDSTTEEIVEEKPKKKKKSKKSIEGGFCNEAFDPMYKSPPKAGKITEKGITNPAFDPLYNNVAVEKHALNVIEETNEEIAESFEEGKADVSTASPKKKKKKNGEEKGIPNLAFDDAVCNGDDGSMMIEVMPDDGKKKKRKKSKTAEENSGGITNPCFDDKDDQKSDEIQCDLMLNVVTGPPAPKRRKSVRFSDVNEQRIIPNNHQRECDELFDINNQIINQGMENTAEQGFVNNGFDSKSPNDSFYDETPSSSTQGTDNEAFDRRAANLEEKVKTMSKTIENCEAEVDNDINERRANNNNNNRNSRPIMKPYGRQRWDNRQLDIVVGEKKLDTVPRPVKGGVRLCYKQANLSTKVQPWMRKPGINIAKQGYKHLVKGDIIVYFNQSNLHDIDGYAYTPKYNQ